MDDWKVPKEYGNVKLRRKPRPECRVNMDEARREAQEVGRKGPPLPPPIPPPIPPSISPIRKPQAKLTRSSHYHHWRTFTRRMPLFRLAGLSTLLLVLLVLLAIPVVVPIFIRLEFSFADWVIFSHNPGTRIPLPKDIPGMLWHLLI